MERLRLPIGIQTFREIREDGHYYVDKTPHILELVEGGKHYSMLRRLAASVNESAMHERNLLDRCEAGAKRTSTSVATMIGADVRVCRLLPLPRCGSLCVPPRPP